MCHFNRVDLYDEINTKGKVGSFNTTIKIFFNFAYVGKRGAIWAVKDQPIMCILGTEEKIN